MEVTKFLVENISVPTEVEAALDKRSSMGILGNLNQYTQFQAANAMEAAAKNPNGGASEGIGLGMGFAMAKQMADSMNQNNQNNSNNSAPPPLPGLSPYHVAVGGTQQGPFNSDTLKQMVQQGTLTKESLVWKSGMSAWTKAGEVADLKLILDSAPPPLPTT